MKIAVPSTRPDLDGTVSHKLGTAPHLLVIETDDMSFEAVDGVAQSSGPGAGVQAVSLVMGMGAQALLVGSISPHIIRVLEKQSIHVVSGVSGTVSKVVADYMASKASGVAGDHQDSLVDQPVAQSLWIDAVHKGAKQLYALVPRLVGVILLLGLFRGFLPEEKLLSLFSGSPMYDAVWGAILGSVLVGNPVNSYVIGESLLRAGAGVAGASALMLAWVSVGVVQLPVEAAALGMRFALVRNCAAFLVAVFMACVLTLLAGGGV